MSDSTLPRHIALIPDGNRRWAKDHHLPSLEGHRRGLERVKQFIQAAYDHHIQAVTVWGFSTENWSREEQERSYLFTLFEKALDQLQPAIIQHQARFHHLGRRDRLPASLASHLADLEAKTAHFTNRHLNIALDYGGRDELIRAIHTLLAQGATVDTITEQALSDTLDTAHQPDPDLIIRTSGEQRTSGLMPWQAAYAEYYFTPVHLPDFDSNQLNQALQDYASRHRRFGK